MKSLSGLTLLYTMLAAGLCVGIVIEVARDVRRALS